jgi:ribosomal-protein-alanine N-acetyltransferase
MNIESIETSRLILRKISQDDLLDIFEITSDSTITKFLTWEPHSDIEITKEFIKSVISKYDNANLPSQWGIVLKENSKLIGITGCSMINFEHKKAEISSLMNNAYSSNGYMTEANNAVVDYLFQKGYHRIQAKVEVSNLASSRMLEKSGFIYEGTFHDYLFLNGSFRSFKYFSILNKSK